MNILEIQDKVAHLVENISRESFLYDFMSIYDFPKSTATRLRKDPNKLSREDNVVILKNKFLFHVIQQGEDLHEIIDRYQDMSMKYNPRFIIVTDYITLLSVDTKNDETLDIPITQFWKHYAFFLPWVGIEKSQYTNENPVDRRAAYKMDKLYQSIIQDNPDYARERLEDLNEFLSRLLFCYFAEDTGIFEAGIFTNSIASHTKRSGEGLREYFESLFLVMNTKDTERFNIPAHTAQFPYVNGGLFSKEIVLPNFSNKSRDLILECGRLAWDAINPDIFGSMIQAVVHPDQRENLGMHYTSVSNIMKVIHPLFLEDLYGELEKANNNVKKLNKLRDRIAKIKIFDPACGSGNFLIIAYKELCKLEIQILKRLDSNQASFAHLGEWNYSQSIITLNNFFGIEKDNFAHEVAKLSLYLAQHQVNKEFEKEFGKLKPILPLRESGNIKCANATRLDWDSVCPRFEYGFDDKTVKHEHEIYVIGNPPYYGARKQDALQKDDMEQLFSGVSGAKNLDYIACWFVLAKRYIINDNIRAAFVSTNSISQGEQVSILWPLILQDGVQIIFAHQSFKWSNNAKGNAGVTCVIIALGLDAPDVKRLYNEDHAISVPHISPYLVQGDDVYVLKRRSPLSRFPDMSFGSMPNDGGHLLLSVDEFNEIQISNPEALKFVRRCYGGKEFIDSSPRYCLWVELDQLEEAMSISFIKERINLVTAYRQSSSRAATRKLAKVPYRFGEVRHMNTDSIIVPRVSSENREYIPIGFLGDRDVITDSANAIYNPEPFIFAVLNSRMHMVWVQAVGGRMKTDIRYSSLLCYNTFPFPKITDQQKEALDGHVYNILEEREKFPEKTMADLYNPDNMPVGLREAHELLDLAIDGIYRKKPFENDEERLVHLFTLYKEMIKAEEKDN